MNPLPPALAFARANGLTTLLFLVLIGCATALGVAVTAQERALREASARAADPFGVIVAGPGSHTDLLMSVVYLQPNPTHLLPPEISSEILAERRATFVAPVAFGDSHAGIPIVGTVSRLLTHLADDRPIEGRMFERAEEAVIGSRVLLEIGAEVVAQHGVGLADEGDHGLIRIVGRLPETGTAWDRAILVPIEFSWLAHSLTTGHGPGVDTIGPPWDPAYLPGIPAFIVGYDSLPAAYALRQAWRTGETTAFFPAEVLVTLYAILGDVRALMGVLTLATQALVVAAVLSGSVALMQLYRTRLAVLRALGATRLYVLAVMWSYVMTLVAGGALVGLLVGWGVAQVVSSVIAEEAGLVLSPRIGGAELALVGALLGLGALVAFLPAWTLFRRPPVTYLR